MLVLTLIGNGCDSPADLGDESYPLFVTEDSLFGSDNDLLGGPDLLLEDDLFEDDL
jgi:hypothetical protein